MKSIDYKTTPVDEAARLMIDRHKDRAGRIARNREDAAETEAGATFWLRVELAIERLQAATPKLSPK